MNNSNEEALNKLTSAISPPSTPIDNGGRNLAAEAAVPPDLIQFVHVYGSGYFDVDGGVFLEVLNPYSHDYWAKQNRDLDTVRQLKQSEGEEHIPYRVYPDQPGLLLWGYGEDRKHFFWLTEGDPSTWPVIVMHDLENCTRFDCSMVVFLKDLMCGELDCSFIGGVATPSNRIDPSKCRFVAEIVPV